MILNIETLIDKAGLGFPQSWLTTIALAFVWAGLMFLYSPLADKIASRWFPRLPTLEAFRSIQQSKGKLIAGIVVAWLLGGFLEEFVFRGVALQTVEALLSVRLGQTLAIIVAVLVAAVGASIFHAYQGTRAMLIIGQLSILFGILFIVSERNLWTVILCHGTYDTVAFIRFANRKSKYSALEAGSQ